eukprot:7727980-Lingulodinium_polyedra.AAC.1
MFRGTHDCTSTCIHARCGTIAPGKSCTLCHHRGICEQVDRHPAPCLAVGVYPCQLPFPLHSVLRYGVPAV